MKRGFPFSKSTVHMERVQHPPRSKEVWGKDILSVFSTKDRNILKPNKRIDIRSSLQVVFDFILFLNN